MKKLQASTLSAGVVSIALGIALFGGPLEAQTLTGKQFTKDATVSVEQARATALKVFPGKIVDEELERGKGGSGLRYSFDIVAGHTRQEVWVDAKTGKVLRSGK